MARLCTVCPHPDRRAIDADVVSGRALAQIVAGTSLSRQALMRHRDRCLVKRAEKAEVLAADNIASTMRDMASECIVQLEYAKTKKQTRDVLLAIRERARLLELQHKIIEHQDKKQANLALHPDWIRVRDALYAAIEPCQACTQRVIKALEVMRDPGGF